MDGYIGKSREPLYREFMKQRRFEQEDSKPLFTVDKALLPMDG
jgi:hypothetical protein